MTRKLFLLNLLFLLSNDYAAEASARRYHRSSWDRRLTSFTLDQRDSRYDNDAEFLYSICTKVHHSRVECSVRIQSQERNVQCPFVMSVRSSNHSRAELISINRLSDQKAIVKWLRMDKEMVVKSAVYSVIDMFSCDSKEFHHPVGLSKDDPTFRNELAIREDGEFDVLVSSESSCEGPKICILAYDASGNRRFRADLSNYEYFDVTSMEGATEPWRYFVAGVDVKQDVFYMLYVDVKEDDTTMLMTLEPESERILSHGGEHRVLCYKSDSTSDGRVVDCITFDNHMHRTFASVRFEEPMKLIRALNIGCPAGDITVLLTSRADCRADECWNVFVTEIQFQIPVVVSKARLNCSGDTNNLAVRVVRANEAALHYACEKYGENDSGTSSFNDGYISLITPTLKECK